MADSVQVVATTASRQGIPGHGLFRGDNVVPVQDRATDATLLPPSPPISDRTLDDVGVEAVLGAMVEQRRASRPCPSEVEFEETPRSQRVAADSDAFLKAR